MAVSNCINVLPSVLVPRLLRGNILGICCACDVDMNVNMKMFYERDLNWYNVFLGSRIQ